MGAKHLGFFQLAFALLLVAAVPVALYHFASGRYPQGIIALGMAVIGTVMAVWWLVTPAREHG